jgi:membrane protease YdiL (CAAX protease family)
MKRGLTQGTSRRLTRLSSIDIPLAAAVAAMPAVLLAAHLPLDLLMPAFAILAFMTALVAAAVGWLTRASRQAATATIWDFAGACVLIGIAAGTFSESVQVSQLLGIATTAP